MRTIAVVTGSRAEYGFLRPVLRAIVSDDALALRLLVCGAHLSRDFAMTVNEIEQDGIAVAERIESFAENDTPLAAAAAISAGVGGFARSFSLHPPDILFLPGDRVEMLAAATAALPFGLPIAHLHGGELTHGAIDDAIRHALTKMSHLHFTAADVYRRRVIQMGEDPDRVYVTGGPGLDNLREIDLLDRAALEDRIGMTLDPAPLLCTFHPVTLEATETMDHLAEMLDAVAASGLTAVFTYPNSDPEGRRIVAALKDFVHGRDDRTLVANLGTQAYFSLMAQAAAMVGNSSSGITEAASFRLPVVNIGSRQGGRLRAGNVIDTAPVREDILTAIEKAVSPAFRASLTALENPYGDGHAAERIVRILRDVTLGPSLTMKRFRDLDVAV